MVLFKRIASGYWALAGRAGSQGRRRRLMRREAASTKEVQGAVGALGQ